MPTKAAKLIRTRAQRIPFRPRDRYSNKGRIHSRRPILSSSSFAWNTAADHTFRVADKRKLSGYPLVNTSSSAQLYMIGDGSWRNAHRPNWRDRPWSNGFLLPAID